MRKGSITATAAAFPFAVTLRLAPNQRHECTSSRPTMKIFLLPGPRSPREDKYRTRSFLIRSSTQFLRSRPSKPCMKSRHAFSVGARTLLPATDRVLASSSAHQHQSFRRQPPPTETPPLPSPPSLSSPSAISTFATFCSASGRCHRPAPSSSCGHECALALAPLPEDHRPYVSPSSDHFPYTSLPAVLLHPSRLPTLERLWTISPPHTLRPTPHA
ncbi:hypothetical protein FA13DRAFT_996924 [Coprinellus micaceus]|uniref:Uncharacterized protein n=1 Tax=Coprinellus micaceus TaxID=71717 RepID=A0A4Y7SYZ6_COPMI|nr:hypothetical protein FA13DRAFT_996924 [Coprinellus micaceus]